MALIRDSPFTQTVLERPPSSCAISVIPPRVEHRIPWPGGPHFTIYLAPNCADQTLAAGTTYWPVLAGNGYRPTSTTADEQGAGGSGWPICDVASTRITGFVEQPL